MRRSRRPGPLGMAGLLLALACGCGQGAASNLSPTPEEAPERFERAQLETEELIRKNREAEQKAMRQAGRFPPGG